MKLKDLAELMGISEAEAVTMLKKQDVIELNLRDKGAKEEKDSGRLEMV
ncbi:hypothetical protein HYV81_01470 [Candidatus Woesearchaeota archaeon]|nr:hypothetical protein [Candidatus Woesearchaeota archaeon]